MPAGSRARWTFLAVTGLALHGLLIAGALGGLPVAARVVAASAAIVLVPGFAFVRLGLMPPGGSFLAAGWALGFGVAWNATLVLLLGAAGVSFAALHPWAIVANAALWAAALAFGRAAPGEAPIGRGARLAVVLAALMALWVGARLGPVMTLPSDAPDHIGTLRRMIASGDAFPSDAFFRDAGRTGVDPRKGVWHPQAALITMLAAADPLEGWRWLPVLLAPLFVLGAAVFGRLAGGDAGAAIAAWALVLTWGGTLASSALRQAVYSSRLADILALGTVAAVIAHLRAPSARLLAAAALLGFAAVTSHLFAAVQIAAPLGALAVALVIRDRGVSAEVRRLVGAGLVVGAAALPFLLWRAAGAYAPANPIHTEPQGLLYLVGHWAVASPGILWSSLGWMWFVLPLAWIPLWRYGRNDAPALLVLAASLMVALLAFNPLAVAVLEPRIGYLLLRLVWLIPVPVFLAWALPRAFRALNGPRRTAAAGALAVIALGLVPALRDAVAIVRNPGAVEAAEWADSPLRWRDALDWMRANLPARSVVLSDPVTSYTVPMMAGRYVVTVIDQHSSPNDPHAVDRLLHARDALDPYATWDLTREVVERYGIDAIAINGRFVTPPSTGYWGPRPETFAAVRGRFDRHPEAFERGFDTGDFVVYRVNRAALATLSAPAPARPYVTAWAPGRMPVARRMGERLPALLRLRLDSAVVSPGDTVNGVADWRALEPLPPGSYSVAIRLDRELPGAVRPPAWVEKPVRKLIERVHGQKYRLRADHLPIGGLYGVDRWRTDEVVHDSFRFRIPENAAEGEYQVEVRMVRLPHFPNFHVSDYFLERDLFSGIKAGRLRVGRPRERSGHVRH